MISKVLLNWNDSKCQIIVGIPQDYKVAAAL